MEVERLTLRERFHHIMKYEEVDRLPNIIRHVLDLNAYHKGRWVKQGMPEDCNPYAYFEFDEADNDMATMWLNRGRGIQFLDPDRHAWPRFETRPARREGDFLYVFDIRGGSLHKRLLPGPTAVSRSREEGSSTERIFLCGEAWTCGTCSPENGGSMR